VSRRWACGLHNVFKETVDDVSYKDADIAKGERVHLKRLELETELIGLVGQVQRAEIREPGLGGQMEVIGIEISML